VLRKGRDVKRRGASGEMVAVKFSMISQWTEVLRHQTMWCGCTDKEMC
jgi:hypothetical protein